MESNYSRLGLLVGFFFTRWFQLYVIFDNFKNLT